MPLMFNLVDLIEGGLGPAAALYMPDDFYVPRKFIARYPDAVAFVLIKGQTPVRLHPVYFNKEENLFLLDSRKNSTMNLVGLAYGDGMRKVLAYLTDEKQRAELEPEFLGPFVSGSLRARLPRKKVA